MMWISKLYCNNFIRNIIESIKIQQQYGSKDESWKLIDPSNLIISFYYLTTESIRLLSSTDMT